MPLVFISFLIHLDSYSTIFHQALGSEVTFIEAMDSMMPTFDKEIAKLANRLLIKSRPIDSRTGVFASEVIPGTTITA